jgi:hypothetical protein
MPKTDRKRFKGGNFYFNFESPYFYTLNNLNDKIFLFPMLLHLIIYPEISAVNIFGTEHAHSKFLLGNGH